MKEKWATKKTFSTLIIFGLVLSISTVLAERNETNSAEIKKLHREMVQVLPVELPAGARAYLWLPRSGHPTTAFVLIHPSANFTTHFTAEPLAKAGFVVLGMASRGQNNDRSTLIEEVILDVKAGVQFLKNEEDNRSTPLQPYLPKDQIKKIVLIGHSGGGPTMSLYQAEAEHNTITTLPSGEPIDLSGMPPVDGLITLSSHRGRSIVLTQEMDASVVDENDLYSVDPSLDMFDPANGFRNYQAGISSMYDRNFLVRYRQAQNDRNDRITALTLDLLEQGRAERDKIEAKTGVQMRAPIDPPIITNRTDGDPRFLDLSLDPSDRLVGSLFGDAVTVNYSPTAFKRNHTTRNWLSTVSRLLSNEATEPNIARVSVPIMVMWATADQGIFRQDTEDIFQAAQCEVLPDNPNKELVHVPGLNHGFAPVRSEFAGMPQQTIEKIIAWTQACVENDCSELGVRRVRLLVGGGEEPLGPPELTDPLARLVPALPPEKRPCGLY